MTAKAPLTPELFSQDSAMFDDPDNPMMILTYIVPLADPETGEANGAPTLVTVSVNRDVALELLRGMGIPGTSGEAPNRLSDPTVGTRECPAYPDLGLLFTSRSAARNAPHKETRKYYLPVDADTGRIKLCPAGHLSPRYAGAGGQCVTCQSMRSVSTTCTTPTAVKAAVRKNEAYADNAMIYAAMYRALGVKLDEATLGTYDAAVMHPFNDHRILGDFKSLRKRHLQKGTRLPSVGDPDGALPLPPVDFGDAAAVEDRVLEVFFELVYGLRIVDMQTGQPLQSHATLYNALYAAYREALQEKPPHRLTQDAQDAQDTQS